MGLISCPRSCVISQRGRKEGGGEGEGTGEGTGIGKERVETDCGGKGGRLLRHEKGLKNDEVKKKREREGKKGKQTKRRNAKGK